MRLFDFLPVGLCVYVCVYFPPPLKYACTVSIFLVFSFFPATCQIAKTAEINNSNWNEQSGKQ